ncbi:murein L,D-transpeptidase catalytic domain family protein [Cyclobacterium xiamenense]|uniref:murein L,D-transpeptidase catalytic domain family protein n=1 Tax=Cyclobacterium xiamenense TaxID=1297121 RepID=UPI000B870B44|nr:murein L,D-transpeptidase catalytic domain family protein [Cyclobacterium xiamenense]
MRKKLVVCLFLIASPVLSFGDAHLVQPGPTSVEPMERSVTEKNLELLERIWENVRQDAGSLRKEVLQRALSGYHLLAEKGMLAEGKPLTLVDFDLPSTEKRLWIIDMEAKTLKHASLVAHGRNSGDLLATNFSNTPDSYMSSLGFYLTGEKYIGKHGVSLRLDGLEKGINDKARARAIVIHSADYATEEFVASYGRLGRSLGCPALPHENFEGVIALIQDKSCLYIHADQPFYQEKSIFAAEAAFEQGLAQQVQ